MSVEQYNQALTSKLVIVYAGALETINRVRRNTSGGVAIDLCCGPGQFTLFLAKHLGYERVIGVDLSEPMIRLARENAIREGLEDRVEFVVGNAIEMDNCHFGKYDLVTCNDAAHHMPSLHMVAALMQTMDWLAKPNGMTLLMDLVRLRTAGLTEKYTRLIGQDYLDRKLDRFYADFCASMHAAWTPQELSSVIPESVDRRWTHLVQRLLPTIQMVVGYPNDGQTMRIRRGLPWETTRNPIPKSMRNDWQMFRALLG